MNDNTLLSSALAYAEIGWRVFPCKPGLKVPATAHGVKDATTNKETITAWWTRWPDANIALACGAESGVYVIDIDFDPDKGIDGWKSLKEFKDLPETVTQNSPRGGAHLFFKSDKPPRNKNNFRAGIDIRSDGYYVMLSPSIHPNGKTYEWAPGLNPFEAQFAEFPDEFRPTDRVIPPWETPQKPASKPTPRPSGGTPVLERASLYLRECDAAVQGQGGHDSLLWAARAMVIGFELSDSDALNLLWNDFNPRCNPPWDRTKRGDVKDFERKVAEARRTPGEKPRGWLLDEFGLRVNETALDDFGKELADGLLSGLKTPETPPQKNDHSDIPEVIRPRKRQPASCFPDWILNPPGMVGQLCAYINETAGCYQPLLSLGASLCACGALFGRKVRDQSNGRTNIYAMGVAHSSAGKDHPADVIEQLLARAGGANILGGNRVTSDSAIEVALQVSPTLLFHWDEAGHMFAAIKQAGVGSGGGQHLRTIVPALMQLYSSAHKLYTGKQRADEEVRRIDQPHVCVWGLTSPDVLYSGLSTSELRDGWLGRVITLISHDRPKYEIKTVRPIPEHLISLTQAWLMRVIQPPEGLGDIQSATSCHQIVIPTQPDAMAVFEAFRDECHEKMIRCDLEGDDTQFLWGKALQNARRISLIIAAGDRFDGAEITEYHARYGCEFIRKTIEMFRESIRNNLADNQWEKDKQDLMKVITKYGPEGVSKTKLTRLTQSIRDKKVRDAYLADMIEAGLIVHGQHPDHPEARSGWLWRHPYGLDVITGGKQ